MIKEVECYYLLCDSCKKLFIEKFGTYSIYLDNVSPFEDAKEEGWIEHEDKHYCPNCYEIDINDNITIKEREGDNE